jgi:hypothetical protein
MIWTKAVREIRTRRPVAERWARSVVISKCKMTDQNVKSNIIGVWSYYRG